MKLIDEVIKAKKRMVIPMMGSPGLQLSKTTMKENLTNAKQQFETIKLLVEKTKPDGIFPFMDFAAEAEAIGIPIKFPVDGTPTVKVHSIEILSDLKNLKIPDPYKDGRMPVFLETVKLLSNNLDILTGAYVLGPYTLAAQMAGEEKLIISMKKDPDFARSLIDFSTKVIKEYADALFNAGAHLIFILEMSGSLLSPKLFEIYSVKYVKQIIENINKPFVLHICGNTKHLIKGMCEVGADGISIDSEIDLSEVITILPSNMVLMGNINSVDIALLTKQEIRKAVHLLLNIMKDCKNFILSSGCELPRSTPIENIVAMIETARSH